MYNSQYIYYSPKESTYFGLDVLKKFVLEVSKHFGYKINAKIMIKSKVLGSGQRYCAFEIQAYENNDKNLLLNGCLPILKWKDFLYIFIPQDRCWSSHKIKIFLYLFIPSSYDCSFSLPGTLSYDAKLKKLHLNKLYFHKQKIIP